MDNLARNAMLAKQAGMSYGKWKALQPRVEVKVQKETKPLTNESKCIRCGTVFYKADKRKRLYCNEECGRMYRSQKKIGLLEGGGENG